MLQGNPYEAERVVQERTYMVAAELARSQEPWWTYLRSKAAMPSLQNLDQIRWGVRALWLPAAFGLGTLLGFVIGQ